MRAELAWFEKHGDYVACGDRQTALEAASADARAVADDPTFQCLTSGLGQWIDHDAQPTTPELAATDRTRTGIWTEVARADDGAPIGFSVHTVCDPDARGTMHETAVTNIDAPTGQLIFRNTIPGEEPGELLQSEAAYRR